MYDTSDVFAWRSLDIDKGIMVLGVLADCLGRDPPLMGQGFNLVAHAATKRIKPRLTTF